MPGGRENSPPEFMPGRWKRPSPFAFIVWIVFLGFFIHGLTTSDMRLDRLAGSLPNLVDFLSQALPPDLGRLSAVAVATVETFEIALVGTVFGALLSLPLALFAAANTSPHSSVYYTTRGFISFLRAIPDLVWGLIFVVVVGLGPIAGIFAITVDTMGFCGRFFAERIEEVEPGPIKALQATGASVYGVIAGAIVPAAFPSFVATTMFALELATRSAVVLGLVGAGGIGVELSTSMQLLRYDEALTIILVIFAVVIAVERLASAIRRRVM